MNKPETASSAGNTDKPAAASAPTGDHAAIPYGTPYPFRNAGPFPEEGKGRRTQFGEETAKRCDRNGSGTDDAFVQSVDALRKFLTEFLEKQTFRTFLHMTETGDIIYMYSHDFGHEFFVFLIGVLTAKIEHDTIGEKFSRDALDGFLELSSVCHIADMFSAFF